MFKIGIYTKDREMKEFLEIEANRLQNDDFCFTTSDRAASTIAQFLYHKVKRETLDRLIPKSDTSENEIESFLLFVPSEYEDYFKDEMNKKIHHSIVVEEATKFYVDGFLTFRIQDFKDDFYQFLLEEYTHFLQATESTDSLETLIEYMNAQPNHSNEIVIVTYENGNIALKENNQCIFLEQDDSQENIIVQSVFASPRNVTVIDNYNVLKKESIIVLTQLFGKHLKFEY